MGASLSADGASLSGTNDFALDAMAKSVHFSKDELQKMQSAFMKIAADSPEAGSTVITLEQFGRALNNVEVPAGAGNFLGLLFNAFDKNGDGVLNYVEFCAGLSIILKGAPHHEHTSTATTDRALLARQARPMRSTTCALTSTTWKKLATSASTDAWSETLAQWRLSHLSCSPESLA